MEDLPKEVNYNRNKPGFVLNYELSSSEPAPTLQHFLTPQPRFEVVMIC